MVDYPTEASFVQVGGRVPAYPLLFGPLRGTFAAVACLAGQRDVRRDHGRRV